MKKILLSALLLAASATLYTGCKKDSDTTGPVITIAGNNPDYSILKFVYTDAGATANDDVDGSVIASSTDNINENVAGAYSVTYSAQDKAGNKSTEIRDVNVVDMTGSYAAKDTCDGKPAYLYTETVTVTTTSSINFSKFGNYSNGAVNGTISGNHTDGYTINIPSQTVLCGLPPAVNRTFSGTGTISFSTNGTSIVRTMVVHFTEVTNGTTATCTDTYIK